MEKDKFKGLPSPVAGLIIATMAWSGVTGEYLSIAVAFCAILEVSFFFCWYHLKNIFQVSTKFFIFPLGILLVSLVTGKIIEGIIGIIFLYALLFFKPVADKILWKKIIANQRLNFQ